MNYFSILKQKFIINGPLFEIFTHILKKLMISYVDYLFYEDYKMKKFIKDRNTAINFFMLSKDLYQKYKKFNDYYQNKLYISRCVKNHPEENYNGYGSSFFYSFEQYDDSGEYGCDIFFYMEIHRKKKHSFINIIINDYGNLYYKHLTYRCKPIENINFSPLLKLDEIKICVFSSNDEKYVK